MKNFSSIFGWMLLAGVLAVPSFLFYNWWSANKAKEAQLAASQQGVPKDFFPGGEKDPAAAPAAESQPLVTPDQGEAPRAEQLPEAADGEAGKQPEPPVRPDQGEAAATAEVPGQTAADPDPGTAPGQQAQPEPADGAAEGQADAAGATGEEDGVSYFKPKTDRNPFLTPDDYSRMRADEARRRREARQRAQAANQAPREVLIESRLNIQGIVGTNVIINGEMYSQGNSVLGAKIIRIGPNYIIGEHKGRRFRKYMQ